ncbi:MAG: hypothetical protein EPN31_00435 [Castellaniella sp.]|uniref:hypothetical protein n=1 Tax=Castellaniella sp. TaxID=1955812 RepID=UPI0012142FA3|nr:hypothetical protein [Castellaniella sp.]TAN31086.1 MAG: hypothetical protein EPN31_00435 [Castellaniella sp.]
MTDRAVSHVSSPQERRVRIELLRLRASYQRLELQRSACRLVAELQPRALAAQARDGLGALGLGWLGHSLEAVRRFPLLLSLASTLFSGTRRRPVLLKAALMGGLIWLGRHRSRKPDQDDQP